MVHLLALQESNPPIHALISMRNLHDPEHVEESLKRHNAHEWGKDVTSRKLLDTFSREFLDEVLKLSNELHFEKLRQEIEVEAEKVTNMNESMKLDGIYYPIDPKETLYSLKGPISFKNSFTVAKRSPFSRIGNGLTCRLIPRGLNAANYPQFNTNGIMEGIFSAANNNRPSTNDNNQLRSQLCKGTSFKSNDLICRLYRHLLGVLSTPAEHKHINPLFNSNPAERAYLRNIYHSRSKHQPNEHPKSQVFHKHRHSKFLQPRDPSKHENFFHFLKNVYKPLNNRHVQHGDSGPSPEFHCFNGNFNPRIHGSCLIEIPTNGGFKPSDLFPSPWHKLNYFRQRIMNYVDSLQLISHKHNPSEGDPVVNFHPVRIGLNLFSGTHSDHLFHNSKLRHFHNPILPRWPHLTQYLEYLESASPKDFRSG